MWPVTESRSVSREAGSVSWRLLATTSLVVLAMLTTGLTVFERGLFQDDAHVLLRTFVAPGGTMQALTLPITSATRRLQGAPYAIALASGEPLLVLRIASEGLTLAIGLLAALLAWYALRLPAAAAFAAGALTLTASSDWLTASFVAIGYNLAIALYLAGALALVRWSQTGRAAWLVAALLCGSASLWTVDAATAVYPFTPILAFLAVDDTSARRRAMWAMVLWLGTAVPYYVTLATFLGDSRGYAAQAIVAGSWLERVQRGLELVVLNFTPWEWAFARRSWFASPPSVIGLPVRLTLALVGVAVTAWTLLRATRGMPLESSSAAPRLRRAVILVGFVVCANAPYAAVHLSEFRYRTELMSRVWASLAVAVVFAFLQSRSSVWSRRAGVALVLVFVGLGILGGLERQDYFAGYSRRHATELGSIVAALPGIDPDARVLLRLPPHPLYAATEAPYLARAWVTLLSADPSLECRTFLLSEVRQASCVPGPDALACRRGDGRRVCDGLATGGGASTEQRLPYEHLIVLTYDPSANIYRLEARLPDDLRPAGPASDQAAAAYAPARQVRAAEASWIARSLLQRPRHVITRP